MLWHSAPRVAAVCEKVDDLQHHLEQQVLKYHCNVCAMVVLQDAESNYYADPKPFYEVNRINNDLDFQTMQQLHLRLLRMRDRHSVFRCGIITSKV